IRRVSLDKFYEIVTGDPDAFYKLCMALPSAIDHVIQTSTTIQVPQDSVMEELVGLTRDNGCSFPMALYLLGFGEYVGF
ncbi:MAG: Eco47II family restriction endonuclease, partial [Raoultibacter sp.]